VTSTRQVLYQARPNRLETAVFVRIAFCAALAASVTGCGPDYSPNTYSSNAVQQANKVDQGVVVGVRQVDVSAAGTTGTLVGGAAGGIAGAQAGSGVTSALGALGGSLVGGIAGNAAEHVAGDTHAFEYIVRKSNGDLLSVTQKDEMPLAVGQKVLVISGNQARVVPDYTVPAPPPKQADTTPKQADTTPKQPTTTTTAPAPGPVAAVPLALPSTTLPSTAPALTGLPPTTPPSTTPPLTGLPSTTSPSTTPPLTGLPSTTPPSTTPAQTGLPSTAPPSKVETSP
jgi:outer membrane lipoprotein SlyB